MGMMMTMGDDDGDDEVKVECNIVKMVKVKLRVSHLTMAKYSELLYGIPCIPSVHY